MANSTFNVQAYLDDEAIPLLANQLGYVMTCNREYADWDKPERAGTRGQVVSTKLPTRLNAVDGLTFDATDSGGDFSERQLAISADQEKHVRYAITDVEGATFDSAGLLRNNPQSAINVIATEMDSFAASSIAYQGYRSFGDYNVQTDQNTTVGEITANMASFKSFGCSIPSYYGMPLETAAQAIQSGLQQFVTKRNDDLAIGGEIGKLGGVQNTIFFQSNLLPTHIAGTAANEAINFSAGYQIDSISVTPPSNAIGANQAGLTTIVLSNLVSGTTIVENDMVDIGFFNTSSPIKFLTFTGYVPTSIKVEGKVVTGGTADGGGNLTIVIEPALIYDATNLNVDRNLTRDIITGGGGDTLRVAKTHKAATIHAADYVNFVAPRLPDTTPFDSSISMVPELKVSMRAYYGHVIGGSTKVFVHDCIYGFGGASEGCGRVLLAP